MSIVFSHPHSLTTKIAFFKILPILCLPDSHFGAQLWYLRVGIRTLQIVIPFNGDMNFYHDDGGRRLLRNVGKYLPDYTVS